MLRKQQKIFALIFTGAFLLMGMVWALNQIIAMAFAPPNFAATAQAMGLRSTAAAVGATQAAIAATEVAISETRTAVAVRQTELANPITPTPSPTLPAQPLESFRLNSNGSRQSSQTVLREGETYSLVVTGLFEFMGVNNFADAQFTFEAQGRSISRSFLAINHIQSSADQSNVETHRYIFYITGQNRPVTLNIQDDYVGDNGGFLTAEIYSGRLEISDLPTTPVK